MANWLLHLIGPIGKGQINTPSVGFYTPLSPLAWQIDFLGFIATATEAKRF